MYEFQMKVNRLDGILLSITNKMQCYTIFFIIVDALHVSGGFSAHHQQLKLCTHSVWYVPGLLLLQLAWLGWNQFHCCTVSVLKGKQAMQRLGW
jgi:hypothetical protein